MFGLTERQTRGIRVVAAIFLGGGVLGLQTDLRSWADTAANAWWAMTDHPLFAILVIVGLIVLVVSFWGELAVTLGFTKTRWRNQDAVRKAVESWLDNNQLELTRPARASLPDTMVWDISVKLTNGYSVNIRQMEDQPLSVYFVCIVELDPIHRESFAPNKQAQIMFWETVAIELAKMGALFTFDTAKDLDKIPFAFSIRADESFTQDAVLRMIDRAQMALLVVIMMVSQQSRTATGVAQVIAAEKVIRLEPNVTESVAGTADSPK